MVHMAYSPESPSAAARVEALKGVRAPPVIEVISDLVCSWCFIGKRRLEKR